MIAVGNELSPHDKTGLFPAGVPALDLVSTLISEEHIANIVDDSIRDGLTGLSNHRFFYRRMEI